MNLRVVGYLVLAALVIDALVAGAVLILLPRDTFLYAFTLTLLASWGGLAVGIWVCVAIWRLAQASLSGMITYSALRYRQAHGEGR